MKKRILLAVLVVMVFTCLFAVSVSADNLVASDTNEYGTVSTIDTLEANKPTNYTDYTSKAVIVGADGSYYTVPSYYLLSDSTTLTWNPTDAIKTLTGMTSNTAKDLRNYVARIEIPEGITALSNYCFQKCTYLVVVKMPTTLTDIGMGTFNANSVLTTVENLENTKITELRGNPDANRNDNCGVFSSCSALTSLSLPSTVTKIEQWAATTCTSLTSVTIPHDAKITYIGRYAFEKSKITEFYFSSELETIGMGAFYQCTKLKTIENFGNTKISEIPADTFQGSPITYIDLPSTLTSVGSKAFYQHHAKQDVLVIPTGVTTLGLASFGASGGNAKINTIVFSPSLTTIGEYAFEKCATTTAYIPATITQFDSNSIFSQWSNTTLYYTIDDKDAAEALKANSKSTNMGVLKNATVLSLEEYEALTTKSGSYLVYGYNPCKAFYNDVHNLVSEEGNTCSGTCDRVGCGLFAIKEDAVHTDELKLAFGENKSDAVDYYANMYVLHVCEYCATEMEATEEYGSIFVKMGFSVAEDDTTSISFFVAVNHKALAKYEEVAKTTVEYGLLVSATPTTSPIIGVTNDEMQLADNTLKIEMTGEAYTKFSVKITGLPENQELNCCGYVVEGEKITYLNHATADSEAAVVSHAIALELQATTGGVEDNGDGEQVEVPVA